MRSWRKNINIDGEWVIIRRTPDTVMVERNPASDVFEVKIQGLLQSIVRDAVGEAVLDSFGTMSNYSVTIRPLTSVPVTEVLTAPVGPGEHRKEATDVNIWFYENDVTMYGQFWRADDTLLHECVHALRYARGKWAPFKFGEWDNTEELIAIMLTNMFASGHGRPQHMRYGHGKIFKHMTQSDYEFYQNYSTQIMIFCQEMPDLYSLLARLRGIWNPIYYHWRVQIGSTEAI